MRSRDTISGRAAAGCRNAPKFIPIGRYKHRFDMLEKAIERTIKIDHHRRHLQLMLDAIRKTVLPPEKHILGELAAKACRDHNIDAFTRQFLGNRTDKHRLGAFLSRDIGDLRQMLAHKANRQAASAGLFVRGEYLNRNGWFAFMDMTGPGCLSYKRLTKTNHFMKRKHNLQRRDLVISPQIIAIPPARSSRRPHVSAILAFAPAVQFTWRNPLFRSVPFRNPCLTQAVSRFPNRPLPSPIPQRLPVSAGDDVRSTSPCSIRKYADRSAASLKSRATPIDAEFRSSIAICHRLRSTVFSRGPSLHVS